MNMSENNTATNQIPTDSTGQKFIKLIISILPWAIVGTLLWAGIFVKPVAVIEEVIPPEINVRDNIFGLSHVKDDTYLAVGNYGKILISTDKGRTWKDQKSPTEAHLQDVATWDENHSVAVGNGGVTLITEDGGETWVEVESPKSEVANKLLRVHDYPNGEAWAVGEMGMILQTNDYGKTWTSMREEQDVFMNDIYRADENTLYIAGEFGLIFKSPDNGVTWEETQTDSPNSFTSIKFRDPQNGVAVGLGGAIVGTHDAGETWKYIPRKTSEMTEHLMDVDWSKAINEWVAVGNKGKWIRFSDDLTEFHSKNVSDNDLTSHTELVLDGYTFLAVGQTVGEMDLKSDKWTLLAD